MPNDQAKIANILQSCLEKIQSGEETIDSVLQKYPDLADRLKPELETALWIGSQSHVFDPSPNFVTASRLRLVRRIEYASASAAKAKPRVTFWDWLLSLGQRRLAFRFALTMLLVLALVFSTNRLALAASYTIPGDMLYPVKMAHENVRYLFAFTPEGELALHTNFARQRLVEIEALILEGRYNYIPATVDGYKNNISHAMEALLKVVERQTQRVEELASQLYQVLAVESQVLGGIFEMAPQEVHSELLRVKEISQAGIVGMQAMPLLVAFLPPIKPTATGTQVGIVDTPAPDVTLVPTETIELPTEMLETPQVSPPVGETSIPGTTPLASPTSPWLPPPGASPTSPPLVPTATPPVVEPTPTNTPVVPTQPVPPTQSPSCNLSGQISSISGTFVVMNLGNNSGEMVTIERIVIYWPQPEAMNQELQSVETSATIWVGQESTSPTVITAFQGGVELRQIAANSNMDLRFSFKRSVVEASGYSITVTFDNGCQVSASD
ncbi:MAG: hypothetical protein IBX69_05545 [Anaerolineales bacterium]|nr:hypothetical protein [Anaerolineales bacterium]